MLKLIKFAAKSDTCILVVPPSLRNIPLIHLTVVGAHCRPRDEVLEAEGVEKSCDRLLTFPQSPGSTRIIPFAYIPCRLFETPQILGLPP